MKPPAYYQGGKGRIAPEILRVIAPNGARELPGLADLCCGSGGVFLRAIADGLPASRVVAVDSGPWGSFWAAVGRGEFPMDRLEFYCSYYRPETWAKVLDEIALEPDLAAFVLCQAGAYGGHPVHWGPGWKRRPKSHKNRPVSGTSSPVPVQWRSSGPISLNKPTCEWMLAGSSPAPAPTPNGWDPSGKLVDRKTGEWRPPWGTTETQRSPSRPSGGSILERMRWIVENCRGLVGLRLQASVQAAELWREELKYHVRYIDPPYLGTAGYGTDDVDWVAVARALGGAWVSEARVLSDRAELLSLNKRSMVGGQAQNMRKPRQEWLSWVA